MIQGSIFGFAIGQRLIHVPTGRPVQLIAMAVDSISVRTLDDIWPHPKTGKPWGGCEWILGIDSLGEFKEEYGI